MNQNPYKIKIDAKNKLALLARKIEYKVYEHGFL
jgi:hypothetical protein